MVVFGPPALAAVPLGEGVGPRFVVRASLIVPTARLSALFARHWAILVHLAPERPFYSFQTSRRFSPPKASTSGGDRCWGGSILSPSGTRSRSPRPSSVKPRHRNRTR